MLEPSARHLCLPHQYADMRSFSTLELGSDDNLWPCDCVVGDVDMDLQPFIVPICQYEARK